MELKFARRINDCTLFVVLIEPLWNWNELRPSFVLAARRLNRTFMELKFHPARYRRYPQRVLIEPLWNWNIFFGIESVVGNRSLNRTFMELKLITQMDSTGIEPIVLIEPLWNWNL